jgi:hypothetical protein
MTEQQAVIEFIKNFGTVADMILADVVQEIEAQGHKATGKLVQSVRQETQKLLDGIGSDLSFLSYGGIVNSGVSASRVPFSIGKGRGGTSKFIQALMNWVRFKNIAGGLDKDIRRATFAIARNMKKEGIPTQGAFRFSANGRRIGFIDYTIDSRENWIESEIGSVTQAYIENVFWAKIEAIVKNSQYLELV